MKIKLNGALREALLAGAVIIKYHEGSLHNTVLTQNPKGHEWRFQIFETVPSIDSDRMCLMTSYNKDKRTVIKEFDKEFYSDEFHNKRNYKNKK